MRVIQIFGTMLPLSFVKLIRQVILMRCLYRHLLPLTTGGVLDGNAQVPKISKVVHCRLCHSLTSSLYRKIMNLNFAVNQLSLYLSGRSFFADVFARFPDGHIQKVSPLDTGTYYQAHVHPKGSHVVFFGNKIGPPRIWKANFTTRDCIALTQPTLGARHPAFSWDGSQIVFSAVSESGQKSERIEHMRSDGLPPADLMLNIFVMDIDGSNLQQLTWGPYQDQRPFFSPDGNTIAFVSNRGGGRIRLFAVPTDGRDKPRPLQTSGWGYRPCFSVDGRWIFFVTGVNGRHQICRMPSEGGGLSPLLNDDQGRSHGPFPDPNGQYLLMHSSRGGRYGIWELPFDGSPPRPIRLPGFKMAMHPTKAQNGTICFDVIRPTYLVRVLSLFKRWLKYIPKRIF